MSRLLINYALPLLLPLVVYVTYMWWRRGRARKDGADIPTVERTHIFISLIVGIVLMLAGLTWVAVSSGEGPGDGNYQSPRYEGGKIVPPSFK